MMAVRCSVETSYVGQEQFHTVDQVVMRHAFDIHNALGRFFEERLYQEELARRCKASGFDVQMEPFLHVSHRDFTIVYRLDMLIEHGLVYELKTLDAHRNAQHVLVGPGNRLASFGHAASSALL